MRNDFVNIYGCEITEAEAAGCLAWLQMEEAKPFIKILEALTNAAESNSMNDFQEGRDVCLSQLRREQFLGERKGLRKISRLPDVLSDATIG
jgi:hypothetical protein